MCRSSLRSACRAASKQFLVSVVQDVTSHLSGIKHVVQCLVIKRKAHVKLPDNVWLVVCWVFVSLENGGWL